MSEVLDVQQKARQMLADLCGLNVMYVEAALVVPAGRTYREIWERKKSGGIRIIHAPCDEYSIVQDGLLRQFLYKWPAHKWMYGFVPRRSVVQNARVHFQETFGRVPAFVHTIDLKDAFPSVKTWFLLLMYHDLFETKKFKALRGLPSSQSEAIMEEFIELVLRFTTHRGCLPQGAATSGHLLNLALVHSGVMKRLEDFCRGRCRFSVYADDFTFSSDDRLGKWRMKEIVRAIQEGKVFRVNHIKTRCSRRKHGAPEITGVTLTQVHTDHDVVSKLTLSQKVLRTWRGKLHRLTQVIGQENLMPDEATDGVSIESARSFIGWVRQVFPKDELIPPSIRTPIQEFEAEMRGGGRIRRTDKEISNIVAQRLNPGKG